MNPRYLGVADAAAYLGTSERALRNRVHRRTIPHIKDGKRLLFDVRDLDRHMAERRIPAEAAS